MQINSTICKDNTQQHTTTHNNKRGILIITVTLWCGFVNIVNVEKQYVEHILSVCL
jgi:hypothetical protein